MAGVIGSALSGLAAATTRLSVAANNIANQNSTKTNNQGSVTDEAFVPQQVDQVTLSDGAVQTLVNDAAAGRDLAQDLVDLNLAANEFRLNLKVIAAENERQQYLLDIKT